VEFNLEEESMRKRLGILGMMVVLASCGAGGGPGGDAIDYEGLYYLQSGVFLDKEEIDVVDFARDAEGNIISYHIPVYDNLVHVSVFPGYAGDSTEEALKNRKIFLKEVDITYGEGENSLTKRYYYTREIEGSLELTYSLTPAELIKPPFIYANVLEDKSFTLSEEKDLSRDEFWEEEKQTATYSGKVLSFSLPDGYKDLKIKVENTLCPVNDDGTLGFPCEGSLSDGVLTISSIDSSYLKTDHQGSYTYKGPGDNSFLLSAGVVEGSVRVVFDNDYLSLTLTDDNGNLVDDKGKSYGTVNYDTGVLTLNLGDLAPSRTEEEEVSEWVGYSDTASYSLSPKVKPLSLKLEAYSSTPDDSNNSPVGFCSDDGKGHLVGDCTGTVNYETGEVSVSWNLSSDAGSVLLSYTKEKTVYDEVDFTAQWQTADGNAGVEVSYEVLKSDAPTTVKFAVPPKSTFEGCKVYEVGKEELLEGSDYTTSLEGNYLYLSFTSIPERDVDLTCYFTRKFDFNPQVKVEEARPITIPVKVVVKAVMETGEKLESSQQAYLTVKSPEL
jgi:hypothetical protein